MRKITSMTEATSIQRYNNSAERKYLSPNSFTIVYLGVKNQLKLALKGDKISYYFVWNQNYFCQESKNWIKSTKILHLSIAESSKFHQPLSSAQNTHTLLHLHVTGNVLQFHLSFCPAVPTSRDFSFELV